MLVLDEIKHFKIGLIEPFELPKKGETITCLEKILPLSQS